MYGAGDTWSTSYTLGDNGDLPRRPSALHIRRCGRHVHAYIMRVVRQGRRSTRPTCDHPCRSQHQLATSAGADGHAAAEAASIRHVHKPSPAHTAFDGKTLLCAQAFPARRCSTGTAVEDGSGKPVISDGGPLVPAAIVCRQPRCFIAVAAHGCRACTWPANRKRPRRRKRGGRDGPGSSARAFPSTVTATSRKHRKQHTIHAYAPDTIATRVPELVRISALSCNLPAARSPVLSRAHTPAPPPPPQT
jgi:hypothetical protein